MTDTPNLALPFIYAAQAQKHVTHNEAIRVLDCLVQLSVLSRALATPPSSPADGARYVVAASPTGDWTGHAGNVAAFQDGAWAYFTAKEGWVAWVANEAVSIVFKAGSWVLVPANGLITDHGGLTGLGDDDHTQYLNNSRGDARYTPINPTTLGINATADTTNRLALSSVASLFNHAGSGHQVKVNKNTAGDTASFLFQDNFSGRAEIGLTGDDDFHFKVSANGSTFTEAIKINKTTGEVTFPAVAQVVVDRFTASGTWTKPAGAKLCRVTVTGAGGGGGGGGKGASGSAVTGGGGGGGGGRTGASFDASSLGATETITVGAAGSSGAGATTNGAGANGGAGGNSSFGSWLTAYGGGLGSGGSNAAASGGGAGGSQRAAGGNASGATGGTVANSVTGTAGGSGASASFATAPTGGGGGGGCPAAATQGAGAASFTAGGGGASGGGVTSANVFQIGGGVFNSINTSALAGGSTDGANGSAGATEVAKASTGGGGGAGSVASNGGAGGAGGAPGGGGGGGGSAQGGNGGAGGLGGRGEVLIITYR